MSHLSDPEDVRTAAALVRLDRPDCVDWQAAGLLVNRRPAGADRLVTELHPLTHRARAGSLFARLWPFGRRTAP